jgi:hypothetical protein
MSLTKDPQHSSVDESSSVYQDIARLLHESDRVRLNKHGLVELDDGKEDDPVTMTLNQLCSVVKVVEETREYEEGVDPIPQTD